METDRPPSNRPCAMGSFACRKPGEALEAYHWRRTTGEWDVQGRLQVIQQHGRGRVPR